MGLAVSVIIPCYNQGLFLKEALESLSELDFSNYEIIIVNDGSTDKFTNDYLLHLAQNGYEIIFQENKGLSAARNAGISKAKAEYILPLDADNKIRTPYLKEAVEILDSDKDIAVVYGNAWDFGEINSERMVGEYNLQRLMLFNYIDACALIRKEAINKVGGYDTGIKNGMEDWDLWLGLSFAGYKFRYLDKICFDYRVRDNSMMRSSMREHRIINGIENHVNTKYPDKMGHFWITENFVTRFKKSPLKIFLKLLLKSYYPRKYDDLLAKSKIRNGI